MNADDRDNLLIAAAEKLGEHFETVHIVATTLEDNGDCVSYSWGSGNFFARTESLRRTVMRTDKEIMDSPEEGGDDAGN